MRKTMNLKALIGGAPLSEKVALGDDVMIGRDDEDKREGVVKVPNGPGKTIGVLVDGELEMVPDDEVTRTRTDESVISESVFHDGAQACAAGADIDDNPHDPDTSEYDLWKEGWRSEAASERASRRADYADDYGDEAADDYLREDAEAPAFDYQINNGTYFELTPVNDAAKAIMPTSEEFDPEEMLEFCQKNPNATFDHLGDSGSISAQDMISDFDLDESINEGFVLKESFIMGMTAMPSLARMQELAGIRTEAAAPAFLQGKDDDAEEDDKAEEAEAEPADEASTEAETDDEAKEGEADEVGIEVAIVAAEEPTEELVQAAEDLEAAVEAQPTIELGANHPANSGEVQMMSAQAPVEAFPETEEAAPEPNALEVCLSAIGNLEQQLPNVSVKDFAEINKRIAAIQSSLFEGHTGRRLKEDTQRYFAVAYGQEDHRFTVRAGSDDEAIKLAKAEACKKGAESVFVETDSGKKIFDGACSEQSEMFEGRSADLDSYTIELKDSPRGEKYAVYGWGTYPSHSVLAGQTKKQFITWFDSEAEALAAYPQAEVGYRSAHNTYSHLPGENDPVPGGRYPDDY